jgi:hypothetical protein
MLKEPKTKPLTALALDIYALSRTRGLQVLPDQRLQTGLRKMAGFMIG